MTIPRIDRDPSARTSLAIVQKSFRRHLPVQQSRVAQHVRYRPRTIVPRVVQSGMSSAPFVRQPGDPVRRSNGAFHFDGCIRRLMGPSISQHRGPAFAILIGDPVARLHLARTRRTHDSTKRRQQQNPTFLPYYSARMIVRNYNLFSPSRRSDSYPSPCSSNHFTKPSRARAR